nr:coiled-coil domain-containing protein 106-like [Misgurnus anguillicaudatus]
MMSSGQMDDILDSCHQTRGRPKKKQSKDERTEKPDKPPGAAPTFSIALAKAKAETDTLRVKCQHLQEKIEDLTKERDFLRQQLSEAIKMDNMPDKNKDKPADIAKKLKSLKSIQKVTHLILNLLTLLTQSHVAQTLQGRRRKERRRQITEPWQVVKRYESVLGIFKRGSNMADAFRKYGVDRNTIVQSAAIAELAIAAPEKYEEINDKHGKGEKLSILAQKCQDAIMADENIANKIQTMKTDGKLLPIKK